ncbi:MAG: MBL fold metallo-hydrolase [Phycisphaerales bacterium]
MAAARFLFLGTGTSAGIPMIGCSCPVCTSSDPRDSRTRTAAAVQWVDAGGRSRTVLIDAGPDLRTQALRANLTRCDGIVVTHNHVDHIFGLDEVRRFNAVMREPIDVWADDHTMESLQRIYRHIFEKHNNVNDSFVATLVARRISPEMVRGAAPITIHGAAFTPIPLLHGRLPVLGYRIDIPLPAGVDRAAWPFPLAYCTDVSAFPPEAWPRLKGLRTLVLDALRDRSHPTHLTLQQAVNIAGQVGAPRTYFIHMTHDLPHEETQARLPDGVSLAYDGLVLGEPVSTPAG